MTCTILQLNDMHLLSAEPVSIVCSVTDRSVAGAGLIETQTSTPPTNSGRGSSGPVKMISMCVCVCVCVCVGDPGPWA